MNSNKLAGSEVKKLLSELLEVFFEIYMYGNVYVLTSL